nr:hypothetical protein [Candidatus Sigynarchaeota archaeon]
MNMKMPAWQWLAITTIAAEAISVAIQFDVVQVILIAVFAIFAILRGLIPDSESIPVLWLFSGLFQVVYAILYALRTIPEVIIGEGLLITSILRLAAGILAIVSHSFAGESKDRV